jgi:general secretion pathway protein B
MSYILDALKRADAERERGQVPGLHSQPGPSQPHATPRAAVQGSVRRIAWAAGLLLAAAAAAFWWFMPAADAPATEPSPAPQATNPPALAPMPPPAPPALLATAQEPVAPLLAPEPQAAVPQAPAPKPAAPPASTALLIVNGAVLQEGQDVVPGLKLERIGAREAVFNHQGLRFTVGY